MAAFALRPSQVLDTHVQLHDSLAHPSQAVSIYFNGFMKSVLNDAEKKGGQRMRDAAGVYLFHPAKTGSEFPQVLARQLAYARTYQISGDMITAVTATYLKAMERVGHIDEQEVPAEAGFAWFDEPLVFTDVEGRAILHRAISWAMSDLPFSDGTVWHGVRITAWCHTSDEDDYWDRGAMDALKSLGFDGLTLGHSVIVPFGQRFLPRDKGASPPVSLTEPLMAQLNGERPVSGHVSDDLVRWAHTLFMFLDMELVASSTTPQIERHARKRAARSLNHSEVSVITLRRIARAKEGEPGHRIVDWTCRWPVQGFWRHIEEYAEEHHHAAPDHLKTHCLACGARITWVRPHLRGPAYLPLKQPRQVYRLVR